MNINKTCTNCKIEKHMVNFCKSKTGKNGVGSQCKLCTKEYMKKYQKNNREKIRKNFKKYYKNNKEQFKKSSKKYHNRLDIKEKLNKYYRDKRKNNIQYRLIHNLRVRLNYFLKSKNISKNNKTMKSVGCSKEQLTDWIKFNLYLDNLTKYHIDHLIPLSSFNCETFDEVIECKCNHWTNLIPTSPEYNLIKSNKDPTKHELFKQELRIYLFLKGV